MKFLLLCVFGLACSSSGSSSSADGKTTYDLVRFTAPPPWKTIEWTKETETDHLTYTTTDKANGTYCQIFIMRSAPSKGDLTADFESEWQNIVVAQYKVTEAAQVTDTAAQDGWQVKSGIATFAFNNGTSIVMLTSISGFGRVLSIVAVTSSQDYVPAIQTLLGSVEMLKPAGDATADKPATPAPKETAKPAALQGYMDYNPITKSWTWKVRYPPQ